MQYVKLHDNLGKLPNAAPITSPVGYDRTLAVPVITLVLTAERGPMRVMSDRKIQIKLSKLILSHALIKLFIH